MTPIYTPTKTNSGYPENYGDINSDPRVNVAIMSS